MKSIKNVIIVIVILFFSIKVVASIYKQYKESDTVDEKVLFWIIFAMFGIPTVIFYVDYYNVPSFLGWVSSETANRWFDFAATYFSALIGAIIGALALILMTIKQVEAQREKDFEDRRIQNMPLLAYSVSKNTDEKYQDVKVNDYKDGYNGYELFFKLENIGLNIARNISYELFVDGIELFSSKLDKFQSIIKSGDYVWLGLNFFYKYVRGSENNNKNLVIVIYYDDLLGNTYSQKILISFEISSLFISSPLFSELSILDYQIYQEHLLQKDE